MPARDPAPIPPRGNPSPGGCDPLTGGWEPKTWVAPNWEPKPLDRNLVLKQRPVWLLSNHFLICKLGWGRWMKLFGGASFWLSESLCAHQVLFDELA